MSIPALINGVLPPGTYPATIAEIWAAFDQVGAITRPALNVALQHAATIIWARDPSAIIYVDGSYVTSKIDPEDVDLAVRSDVWDDMLFLNALQMAYPGEEGLIDFFFNVMQSRQHMEDLFREIQGSSVRKGVIVLLP